MTLTDFLVWLTAGGSVVALSWIMERIPWFQSLPSEYRRYLQFFGSALLAVIAQVILQYVPQEVLSQIAPYFATIALVFGAVFINQVAHFINPWRVK